MMLPKSDNSEVAEMCFKLWDQYQKNEITHDEMQKELAYCALTYSFEELRYIQDNLVMPFELIQYLKDKKTNKKVSVDNSFWKRPDIENYINKKDEIKHKNIANYTQLKDLEEQLKQDPINRIKVQAFLKEFPSSEWDDYWEKNKNRRGFK